MNTLLETSGLLQFSFRQLSVVSSIKYKAECRLLAKWKALENSVVRLWPSRAAESLAVPAVASYGHPTIMV